MIAAATHSALPWIFSAGAASIAILAAVVQVGRWAASVEDRLRQHQKDLTRLGRAESAIEREHDQP